MKTGICTLLERRDGVDDAGMVLPAVVILSVFLVSLGVGLLDISFHGSRVERERAENVQCSYLAQSGLDASIAEIASGIDPTGFGLGAMGVVNGVSYTDSQGNKVGEFKTVLRPIGVDYEVLVVSAVPDFANPRFMRAVRGRVASNTPYLTPPRTAFAIVGALEDPELLLEGDVHIDGGSRPAFAFTKAGYAGFMDELGDAIVAGDIDPALDLLGGMTSTYEHPTAGTIELPVVATPTPSVTMADLDLYRQNFRAAALAMAASADRVLTATIKGDQTWGTAGNPEITVIDAGVIGKQKVFGTKGQTITGNGTLIIEHTVWPSNVNIDWTGDIYVVGFNGDSQDTLKARGLQGTINGNLIVLGSDTADAAVKLLNQGWTPSDLTVNGNVLTLGSASSYEAEIEISNTSSLTVNGIAALFSSHSEIQTKHKGATLEINGSLVMGMTGKTFPAGQNQNIEAKGSVNITYDEMLAQDGIDAMGALQEGADLLNGVNNSAGWGEGPELVARVAGENPYDVLADIDALIQAAGDPYSANFGIP